MPRGDGTGPLGIGQMTGRGAGYCARYSAPGYANPPENRGSFRRGRFGSSTFVQTAGRGIGWQNRFYETGMPCRVRRNPGAYSSQWNSGPQYAHGPMESGLEIETLKAEAQNLESTLREINKRLSELEADTQAE